MVSRTLSFEDRKEKVEGICGASGMTRRSDSAALRGPKMSPYEGMRGSLRVGFAPHDVQSSRTN
jgi:hypothetical protein